MKASTPHPAEVRKHFHDYAAVLGIYADDQIASLRWQRTKREKDACELRAAVYRDLAEEIRSIVFEKGELE